ncbi:MAG: hypothetical protein H7287_14825, partial [Thermoleophilia bacterium]|nr:hypothetical protein [Thermoleophilia bacterium]
QLGGQQYAAGGLSVATDAAGNVYLADGAWAPNQTNTVVKYGPDGRVLTRFGSYGDKSWAIGSFYWMLTGLTVTDDGATVYTSEVGNNRIQTWQRQGDGSYIATSAYGGTAANNADRGGYCNFAGWQGAFAAPYDVALDGAGNIYVLNTTCKQVLRFSPAFRELTANVDVRVAGGDYPRPHGFAVSRNGVVFVGENQRVLVPTGTAFAAAAPPVRGSSASTTPTPTPNPPPPSASSSTSPAVATPAAAPPTAPSAVALRNPLRIATRFARRVLVGPRSARRLVTQVKCTRACTVRVLVRDRRGTVGFATRRGVAGRYVSISVPLGRKRLPGRTQVTVSARTATGDVVSRRRVVSLGR